MKRQSWTAFLLGALLVGCASPPWPGPTPDGPREEITLDVRSVSVPASVGAAEALPVSLEVTVGGCVRFLRVEATRTPARLSLRAVGDQPVGNVPCPAYIGWQTVDYTDSATPTRTTPFEVAVNGEVRATVEVR